MSAPHLHLVQNLVDTDTGEVVGCQFCAEARAEAEVWEGRVLELERKMLTDLLRAIQAANDRFRSEGENERLAA